MSFVGCVLGVIRGVSLKFRVLVVVFRVSGVLRVRRTPSKRAPLADGPDALGEVVLIAVDLAEIEVPTPHTRRI